MATTPTVPATHVEQHLPRFRAALERCRAWLGQEITERRNELAAPDGSVEEGIGHGAAPDLYERQLRLTEIATFERDLRDVEAALGRMRAGTYGTCLDCGHPIPLDRLAARPQAARDVDCERALERKAVS